VLATWSLLLQGCYESSPIQQGVAPASERLELVLNDKGRAALGDRLGPGVAKVEGMVVKQDSASYTMSVFHVTQIDGSSSTWTGQEVAIGTDGTIGFQMRRLNKTRTTLLTGGIVVGVVAIFAKSLNLLGGSADNPPGQGPPGPQMSRHR
jgi:hypothetical protein